MQTENDTYLFPSLLYPVRVCAVAAGEASAVGIGAECTFGAAGLCIADEMKETGVLTKGRESFGRRGIQLFLRHSASQEYNRSTCRESEYSSWLLKILAKW